MMEPNHALSELDHRALVASVAARRPGRLSLGR